MQTGEVVKPLLAIMPLGVHLLTFPSGRWGFFGCIPEDLNGKSWSSYHDAFNAFVEWFKQLEEFEQIEFFGLLREDVKAAIAG